MAKFRFANTEDVVRYSDEDGDYIDLRAELTKAEANKIMGLAPSGERDIEGGLAFLERFFQMTIRGWSMQDEEGNPVLPTVEAYRRLEAGGARQIDEWLGQHLQKTLGNEVEKLEGESSS